MADSKRLAVMKALTAVLEAADLSVSRGKLTYGDEKVVPLVSIIDGLNPDRDMVSTQGRQVQKHWWPLLLNGWATDDEDNPTDPAYLLMAEVQTALGPILDDESEHYMLGGLIADMRVEPGTVRPNENASARAFFYLRVHLELVEDLLDPYRLD